jgi:hypothetical protein
MILHPDDFGRLVNLRAQQLREEAERARLAHLAPRRRWLAWARRPRVTIEVNLPDDLRPEQVERIFANLARHLKGAA